MTTLPQGVINSVAQFYQVSKTIVSYQFKYSDVYIDNIITSTLKKSNNKNKLEVPEVYYSILEYTIRLNTVFIDIEYNSTIILDKKFNIYKEGVNIYKEGVNIYKEGVNIINYYYDRKSYYSSTSKVATILNWLTP